MGKSMIGAWNEDHKKIIFNALMEEYLDDFMTEKNDSKPKITKIQDLEAEAKELVKTAGQLRGLPTGYRELDNHLLGFDGGEMIIVSGATGTGKTMFALNLLVGAYKANGNFNSLIVSLEMPSSGIAARILQILNATGDQEMFKNMPISFASFSRISVAGVKEACVQTKADFVIIDHLHYFSRNADNQSNEIGNITREVKRIAVELEIPIILISHIRKRPMGVAEDRKPNLDDLRDSSFIAQDADVVIMLSRDVLSANKDDRLNLTWAVLKSRNKGKLGKGFMRIGEGFKIYEQVQQNYGS